jgi:hypothetical protein
MIKNNPGPLSDWNLPSRNITAFSQGFAILMDAETKQAIMNDPTAIVMPIGLPIVTVLAIATPAITITKNMMTEKKLVLLISALRLI